MSAALLPLLIHYLVDVSHFAECCENRPMTVREMLINLVIPYSAMAREVQE